MAPQPSICNPFPQCRSMNRNHLKNCALRTTAKEIVELEMLQLVAVEDLAVLLAHLQLLQLGCSEPLRQLLPLLGLLLPHLVVSVALEVLQLLQVDLEQLVVLGLRLRLASGLRLHSVHLHQPLEVLALPRSEHQLRLRVYSAPLPRHQHQVVAYLAVQHLHLEDYSGQVLLLLQHLELQLLPQAVYLVARLQLLQQLVCLVPLHLHPLGHLPLHPLELLLQVPLAASARLLQLRRAVSSAIQHRLRLVLQHQVADFLVLRLQLQEESLEPLHLVLLELQPPLVVFLERLHQQQVECSVLHQPQLHLSLLPCHLWALLCPLRRMRFSQHN
mmetsp:Transcript_36257/g.87791  ORF Transcript_36257/g.87791 Transcript_36257/m.87791 type:complete len:330 (+) Transcript_36257:2490-3479(+)